MDRDLNKDKTVGFVLERLIGAMTVQQKMDSVKTEHVAETSQEEEQVINKTVNEVVSLPPFHFSYRTRRPLFKRRSSRSAFPSPLSRNKSWTWKRSSWS